MSNQQKPKIFKKLILDNLKALDMKAIADKIKSVTYDSFAGGDAVRVRAVNLYKSERDALEKVLESYRQGHFGRDEHGNEDIYSYKKEGERAERVAKYVSLDNEFTPEVYAAIKEQVKNERDVIDDASAHAKTGRWYDTLIWNEICALESAPEAVQNGK